MSSGQADGAMVYMIVSISRRCDIPRFNFDWFFERLDAGFAEVINPFNSRQRRRISLLPTRNPGHDWPRPGSSGEEGVDLFVFWTRDPVFILNHTEELEDRGYRFYVMITLTSYPALLEPNVPSAEAVVQTMRELTKKISPDRVIWRYDPLFLSNMTDLEFHRRNFSRLAVQLNGTVRRVIVSVYDEYPRAESRLARLESGGLKRLAHYENSGTKILSGPVRNVLSELAQIARRERMEIQSCAEEDLSDCGILPGACIDGNYIEKNFGIKAPGKDRNQNRPYCLCVQSVDIGTYGHCPAKCVYCYATS